MQINEFSIVIAIFVIGILIIGLASFSLYNQVSTLELENRDLDINIGISTGRINDLNYQNINLINTVAIKDNSISSLTTQNNALVTDNNTLLFNYNIGQQELSDIRVFLEAHKNDVNAIEFDYNLLLAKTNDYNANLEHLNESYLDLKSCFIDLRDDFSDCYWASNCTNDENACQDAYGAALDANVLKTLFATTCVTINSSDLNEYFSFE